MLEREELCVQLNIYIPDGSPLAARVQAATEALGISASKLGREVLEVALEPYVRAHTRADAEVRAVAAELLEANRHLRSGAVPPLPYDGEEADVAPSRVVPVERQPAIV
jgi:hypothetical protein